MKLFLTIFLFPVLVNAGEARGNEGAHGGDSYAQEFVNIGLALAKTFRAIDPARTKAYNFTAVSFKTAVDTVQVTSEEHASVKLKNIERDAINYPDENRILLNRTRWREASLQQKLRLVMHEYFGILNVERDHYNVSYEFQDVVIATQQTIQQGSEVGINVFYGRCVKAPPLNQVGDACAQASAELLECAVEQAASRCQTLSPDSGCKVLTVESERKMSPNGFLFCEATAISK